MRAVHAVRRSMKLRDSESQSMHGSAKGSSSMHSQPRPSTVDVRATPPAHEACPPQRPRTFSSAVENPAFETGSLQSASQQAQQAQQVQQAQQAQQAQHVSHEATSAHDSDNPFIDRDKSPPKGAQKPDTQKPQSTDTSTHRESNLAMIFRKHFYQKPAKNATENSTAATLDSSAAQTTSERAQKTNKAQTVCVQSSFSKSEWLPSRQASRKGTHSQSPHSGLQPSLTATPPSTSPSPHSGLSPGAHSPQAPYQGGSSNPHSGSYSPHTHERHASRASHSQVSPDMRPQRSPTPGQTPRKLPRQPPPQRRAASPAAKRDGKATHTMHAAHAHTSQTSQTYVPPTDGDSPPTSDSRSHSPVLRAACARVRSMSAACIRATVKDAKRNSRASVTADAQRQTHTVCVRGDEHQRARMARSEVPLSALQEHSACASIDLPEDSYVPGAWQTYCT